MIQRIQTIWLVLAALLLGLLFMLPMATSDQPAAQFLSDQDFDIWDHPVLLILTIAGILTALVNIFLFKKRKVQLKIGYLLIVIAILLPLISFLLFTNATKDVGTDVQVHDQAGMFLPLGVIVFAALANYFIRKDEKLVKSMDRLR